MHIKLKAQGEVGERSKLFKGIEGRKGARKKGSEAKQKSGNHVGDEFSLSSSAISFSPTVLIILVAGRELGVRQRRTSFDDSYQPRIM